MVGDIEGIDEFIPCNSTAIAGILNFEIFFNNLLNKSDIVKINLKITVKQLEILKLMVLQKMKLNVNPVVVKERVM